ncbi:ADAM family mig-17 [Aphelenchoides bicaudatus]|nr:ADAM family mig-17 [Aphelenchoides bicaudatus]
MSSNHKCFILHSLFVVITYVSAQDKFKMESDFMGVHFEKLLFFENTTLLEDITYVDSLVSDYKSRSLLTQPDQLLQSTQNNQTIPFQFQIDILMVADYSMYQKFSSIYRNNNETAYIALREYLEAIFDQVTTIYERLRFFDGQQIHLHLVDAMPIIRPEDCPLRLAPNQYNATFDVEEAYATNFTEVPSDGSIEALTALHAINAWLDEYSDLLPKHDHALVVTGRDLLSQANETSTQGLAYVRAMCRGPDSSSIVEDVGGLTTATIAAHEMMHRQLYLGAFHDGSGNSSDCPGRLNYLMSPSTSGNENNAYFNNTFRLSNCSIEHVEDFLSSSDAECLIKPKVVKEESANNPTDLPTRMQKLKLGERFDQTLQCKITFGHEYGACTMKDFSARWSGDPCRRLWCKNRQTHRFLSCETRAYLPLMDWTECGHQKWCVGGVCVPRKGTLIDDCVDLRKDYCRKFAEEPKRRSCISKHIRDICCRTCKNQGYDSTPTKSNQSIVKKNRIKIDL